MNKTIMRLISVLMIAAFSFAVILPASALAQDATKACCKTGEKACKAGDKACDKIGTDKCCAKDGTCPCGDKDCKGTDGKCDKSVCAQKCTADKSKCPGTDKAKCCPNKG